MCASVHTLECNLPLWRDHHPGPFTGLTRFEMSTCTPADPELDVRQGSDLGAWADHLKEGTLWQQWGRQGVARPPDCLWVPTGKISDLRPRTNMTDHRPDDSGPQDWSVRVINRIIGLAVNLARQRGDTALHYTRAHQHSSAAWSCCVLPCRQTAAKIIAKKWGFRQLRIQCFYDFHFLWRCCFYCRDKCKPCQKLNRYEVGMLTQQATLRGQWSWVEWLRSLSPRASLSKNTNLALVAMLLRANLPGLWKAARWVPKPRPEPLANERMVIVRAVAQK